MICTSPISTRIRIETIAVNSMQLLVDSYQSYIHKNKD